MSQAHAVPLAVDGGAPPSQAERTSGLLDLASAVPRPWPALSDLALCAAVFGLHVFLTDEYYTLGTALYGGLEAATLVLLVTRYAKLRPPRLPWIEVCMADHYLEFGLALLTHPDSVGVTRIVPHPESFEFASLVALVSIYVTIGAFGLTVRFARRFRGDFLLPTLTPEILERASPFHLVIAASYVVASVLLPAIKPVLLPVANILQMVFFHSPLLVVAVTTYLLSPRPRFLVQLLIAFGAIMLDVVTTSMLGDVLVPLIAVAAIWWRARWGLPLRFVAVAAAIVLVLQPVKSRYRYIRLSADNYQTSVVDAWMQAFTETEDQTRSAHIQTQTTTDESVSRMSELTSFAYTVEVVPDSIPNTGGIVYPMFFASIIPRVFWPEKPNMTRYALNPFTNALGLTTPQMTEYTTTGITLDAQGYLEHGIAGTLAWKALLGFAIGFVCAYFGSGLAGVIAGGAILAPVCAGSGGGFQGAFGSLWQEVFGATLLVWFLWLVGGGYRRPILPLVSLTRRSRAATR
ncbi:MAG TPA: hypothetical protein VKU41_09410 [Polyangiaceae bacterium]|nr:hypothetical protein [Polyangiaceae bacterium]